MLPGRLPAVADTTEEVPYQSLYRRFRPSTFAEVLGQDHVVLALRNAVRDSRVAHAYLFSGPRGTGKTSTARILAKALNCTDLHDGEPCGVCPSCVEITKGTSLDVHELDAASNNGVEAMRDLVSRAALGSPGRQKVYIVDEVHMLSTAASNALLKTLEEPPAHVVFVLATTDPQKVLPTIRSRTQHYEFRLLGADTLSDLLTQVRQAAHLDVGDDALEVAVRRGRGSARDALSILDQVAASDSVDDDLPQLDEVVEALAEQDVTRALVAVAGLVGSGFSPQQLTADLVDHLRQEFLAMVAPDLVTVSGNERAALAGQGGRVGLATLVRAMEELGRAQVAMRDAPDPRVNLEVTLVRLVHPEADDSPAALLARIERLEAGGVRMPADDRSGVASATPAPTGPSVTGPAAARALADNLQTKASAPGGAPAQPVEAQPAPSAPTAPPTLSSPPPASASPEPASVPNPGAGLGGSRPTLGALRRGTAAPAHTPPPPGNEVVPEVVEAVPSGQPEVVTAEPAGPAEALPSQDELVQAWGDQVISRLRPKAKALFQAGRFVGSESGRISFGLPNEIHRDRCEEMRPEVEAALADHFGRAVPIVLVVDGGPAPVTAPEVDVLPTPADGPEPTPAVDLSAGPQAARAAAEAPPAFDEVPDDEDEVVEDLAVFEDEDLVDADVDNSAEARLLEAFPGAEEVG